MGNDLFRFNVGHFSCFALQDDVEGNTNVLLINTGQHRVLIDTGNGDATSPPGRLLDRLSAVGMSPAEIDVVILSHADVDHIAGTVDSHGTLTFPNARYVMAREEWAFWTSNAPRFPARARAVDALGEALTRLAETVPYARLPHVRSRLDLIEFDAEIVPGIQGIAAPGHTPGMMAIGITSDNEQLLFIADIYYGWDDQADPSNAPKAIGDPVWHAALDVDPAQAVRSRDRVFTQAAQAHTLLMATHVRFPGLGYVTQHGPGWQWLPYVAAE